MKTQSIRIYAAFFLLSACDSLVYGERSGVNIAIRTDVAEGQPLEFNTGFQRRVVGYVPQRSEDGGEAVNMVSAFDLKRTSGTTDLDAKTTINAAFASGKAATSVGQNITSVKAIFDRPGVPASAQLTDQQNSAKIYRWFGNDPIKAAEYITFLEQYKGVVTNKGNDVATAYLSSNDGRNAALNTKFIKQKKL